MNTDYKTIKISAKGARIEEKRSIFVAIGIKVETKEQVQSYLEDVKREQKKATHNAWAYRLFGKDGEVEEDCSDDGELKGCAGKPILNTLNSNNIVNTLMIVSRFYGGINLGRGGLVRNYSKSSLQLLKLVGTIDLTDKD